MASEVIGHMYSLVGEELQSEVLTIAGQLKIRTSTMESVYSKIGIDKEQV